jgi:hypothetical protein
MVLAAPALGYELVEALFPRGSRGGPAALLRLKPLVEAMPEPLFSTLLTRQSNAGKYLEGAIQEIHLDRLRNLPPFSSDEKIYFMTEEVDRQGVIRILHDLSHEAVGFDGLLDEAVRWIRPATDAVDGLPMDHLGLPISVRARFGLMRHLSFRQEIREVARQALLRQGHRIEAPAYFLVTTQNREPRGYFNVGRWHARLALTLSEMELGAQTLHLPMMVESSHASLNEIFKATAPEEPVLLVRFGRPEKKTWPKTSRRPIDQCFLKVGEA